MARGIKKAFPGNLFPETLILHARQSGGEKIRRKTPSVDFLISFILTEATPFSLPARAASPW